MKLVQSVMRLTADPGVASLFPAPTFVEIDREIISTVILLLQLIQEGFLSFTSKSMCTKYWSGFPRALENLENHKKKFHAWKNHGI